MKRNLIFESRHSKRKSKEIIKNCCLAERMLNELSRSKVLKNSFLVILVTVISVGSLAMNLYEDRTLRKIDEESSSISCTYYAKAGGWRFSYDSQHAKPWLEIYVKEPGWYNLTYSYFNGNSESRMVNVCDEDSSSWEHVSVEDGTILLGGEWSGGWLKIVSFCYKLGETFRLFRPDVKNLERIEVNGVIGYFTPSWKEIEVDVG